MALAKSYNHGLKGKVSFIIAVIAIISAILFGCAHRGNVRLDENASMDTLSINAPVPSDFVITDSGLLASIRSAGKWDSKLERVRAEYEARFGHPPHVKKLAYDEDTLSADDQIVLIEYALRHDYPEWKPNGDDVSWSFLINAKYESRFGRPTESIICRYADGVCQGPLPQLISCDRYMRYLFQNAMQYNTPILEDTVIVSKLDLWISEYCGGELQTCSFPSWFQEFSDEDKVRLLEFAIRRPRDSYGNDVDQIMIGRSYLSSDREASIKDALSKIVAEQKIKLGRDMTELEMAHAGFEVQYQKAIPNCEQCTDEELLAILKFMTQMNTPYISHINRDRVVALFQRINGSSNRKMTAAEMIAAELEFFAGRGKRINCPQCSDDELYIAAKHYEKRWSNIPDTLDNNFLDSLKQEWDKKHNRCRQNNLGR